MTPVPYSWQCVPIFLTTSANPTAAREVNLCDVTVLFEFHVEALHGSYACRTVERFVS